MDLLQEDFQHQDKKTQPIAAPQRWLIKSCILVKEWLNLLYWFIVHLEWEYIGIVYTCNIFISYVYYPRGNPSKQQQQIYFMESNVGISKIT